MSNDERRNYNRLDEEFNVRVAKEVKDNQFMDMPIDIAKSVNISASGLCLFVKGEVKERDILRITFLKPNTFEFFEGLARVERVIKNKSDSYEVGLSFFNLSTSEMKHLDYYISLCD